jgi:hypothetical protein
VTATSLCLIGWLSLASAGPSEVASVTSKGFGRTVEDAKLSARQGALTKLQERLLDHDPPLTEWQPTLTDVERLLLGPGTAGNFVEPYPGVGVYKQWIVEMRVMSDDELRQRDRQAAREHQAGIGFVIVMTGLVLGVGVRAVRSRRPGCG